MNRLTARSPKNNMAYLINVKQDEQDVESPYPNTLRCIMDSFNRLAAYEDSELSPEEVTELTKAKAEGRIAPVKCPCDASEEAQELMKAKADGRLVVLPCKVGDTVYADCCGDIIGWEVYQIEMRSDAPDKYYACGDDEGYAADEMYFEKSDIGKTVFLSREAAEKAIMEVVGE